MKTIYVLALICLTSACSSNKVSESDLSGKTFQAKLQLNSDPQQANSPLESMVLNVLANSKVQYAFKNNQTGTYTTELGLIQSEKPFKWALTHDILQIDVENEGRSIRYAIQPTKSGFTMKTDSLTIKLVLQ